MKGIQTFSVQMKSVKIKQLRAMSYNDIEYINS